MPRIIDNSNAEVQNESRKPERKEQVFVTFPKSCVEQGLTRADGKEYNRVTIPKGTVVNGQNLTGFVAYPFNVHTPKFDADKFFSVRWTQDKPIKLFKTQRDAAASDEAGKFVPVTDASGKPIRDEIEVMPADLKKAVDQQRNEYRANMRERREAREAAKANKVEAAKKAAKTVEAPTAQKEAPAKAQSR